jgi:hypothetical protein
MPNTYRTIVSHHSENLDIEIGPHAVAGRGVIHGRTSWAVVYRNAVRPRVAYGVMSSETGARAMADIAADTWERRASAALKVQA